MSKTQVQTERLLLTVLKKKKKPKQYRYQSTEYSLSNFSSANALVDEYVGSVQPMHTYSFKKLICQACSFCKCTTLWPTCDLGVRARTSGIGKKTTLIYHSIYHSICRVGQVPTVPYHNYIVIYTSQKGGKIFLNLRTTWSEFLLGWGCVGRGILAVIAFFLV